MSVEKPVTYSTVVADLQRDATLWKGFVLQGDKVIEKLKHIVTLFNEDLKKYDVPFSSIRWVYGDNGKTVGMDVDFLFISGFNTAFGEWRHRTGCDANFFIKSRDGREVEELIILDIKRTLYANTDTKDLHLQNIMDDAVKESSRKE